MMGELLGGLAKIAKVVNIVAPLVAKKGNKKTVPAVKNKAVQALLNETGQYEFSWVRTLLNAVIGGLLIASVQNGYLTVGQAECVQDIADDKIEVIIDKVEEELK